MALPEVYYDDKGRRRIDRSKDGPATDPGNRELEQVKAELAALRGEFWALKAKAEKTESDLASFQIIGTGLLVTGSGPQEITIDASVLLAGISSAVGEVWYSVLLCDGTTLEVRARNVVPP